MEGPAAARYYRGFKQLRLPEPMLSYEPRSSCQCPHCATVWVGTKSGIIMQLQLAEGAAGEATGHQEAAQSTPIPTQRWFRGEREARSVCHVHDGLTLGSTPVLLIGRDDGSLEIVPERHPGWVDAMPAQAWADATWRLHLDTWWERRADLTPQVTNQNVECAPGAPRRFAMGITAIAATRRPGTHDITDILVTTRNPWLYVIEAEAGKLRLVRRLPLPGWIDWIFMPRSSTGPIVLLSRGGDLLRIDYAALLNGEIPVRTALGILPSAAIQLDTPPRTSLLDGHAEPIPDMAIGTKRGLVLLHDVPGSPLALRTVPATRAGVLSIGAAEVNDADGVHRYLTLGLDDGRLRVIDIDLVRNDLLDRRRQSITPSFSVDLGAAVLAEQTLRPSRYSSECAYIVAVLRDHSVQLFQVTSERTQRDRVTVAWDTYVRTSAASHGAEPDMTFELALASSSPPVPCEPAHWAYALVDVILPRMYVRAAELAVPERATLHAEIVGVACKLIDHGPHAAPGMERRALHRVASNLGELTGDDIRLVMQLSEAIVRVAVTGGDAATPMIEDHLHALGAIAAACDDVTRPQLVAWMRFLRKYIVRGEAFAEKRFRLAELVEQNYKARKHLDALIYQARLHRRGYDLRWEIQLGEDIAVVHITGGPADHAAAPSSRVDPPRPRIVVVTATGRLVVLDRESGHIVDLLHQGTTQKAFAPFAGDGTVRVLAATIVETHGTTRVVMSCDGAKYSQPHLGEQRPSSERGNYQLSGGSTNLAPPGLAVIDLVVDPRRPDAITVADVAYPTCSKPVRVYAIEPLPGHPDTFVAGLDSRAYRVGRVHRSRGWTLELAMHQIISRPHDDQEPRFAPGTAPTRAVAVVEIDAQHRRFLVATGSDDGQVLAFDLDASMPASHWQLAEWGRVSQRIQSVALGRHDKDEDRGEHSRFSCYLGTSTGDVLALSIDNVPASGGQPFGPYVALPLWRESHRDKVVATRLWRTKLFRDREVMVVATTNGRLCIYRHDDCKSHQVSARNNYYFRGIRYDRVALPEGIQALALAKGGNDLVATRPGGIVYLARLLALRESPERGAPGNPPPSVRGLPAESWARLHHLLAESEIVEPFDLPATQRWRRKLELCDLIRLGDGVLSTYAMRQWLIDFKPWNGLTAPELGQQLIGQLRGLCANRAADAERIKVVFKSACGAFLSLHPDVLCEHVLKTPKLPVAESEAIAVLCRIMRDEILSHLTHGDGAGARIAIVGMKELLRVPVLRAISADAPHGARVREAIEGTVIACLRHDVRLVRTEALRAISVMLRNLGVMVNAAMPDTRARLLAALLPDGLRSLGWLFEPLIDDLLYFQGFKLGNVLVSGAWYRASAIAQLFWIFPDHSLALCDHMLSRGLPVDVLALCAQTMRGSHVRAAKQRIEHNFLTGALGRDIQRSWFIDTYRHDDLALHGVSSPADAWDQIDDEIMANQLGYLYDKLARMWAVDRVEQLHKVANWMPGLVGIPSVPNRSLDALARTVEALANVAREFAQPGRRAAMQHRLGEFADPGYGARAQLTAPMQFIVSAIVDHWRALPVPPEPDMTLGKYRLGRMLDRRGGRKVFEIASPAGLRDSHVVAVYDGSSTSERTAFVDWAQFNRQLSSSGGPAGDLEFELVNPEAHFPAYLAQRYSCNLESYLTEGGNREAAPWVLEAVLQLGGALQTLHHSGRSHGDVSTTNVHVLIDPRTRRPSFHLGAVPILQSSTRISESRPPNAGPGSLPGIGTIRDVDLVCCSAADPVSSADDAQLRAEREVPVVLSQKCQSPDALHVQQWDDVAALGLIAYRMLTGETISSTASTLRPQRQRLEELAGGPSDRRTRERDLIAALQRLFDVDRGSISVHAFLQELSINRPPRRSTGPVARRTLKTLFLAANPCDTVHLPWLEQEHARVKQALSNRPDIQLTTNELAKNAQQLDAREFIRLMSGGHEILHFAGHGSANGIVIRDHNSDRSHVVTPDALARCFKGRGLSLVVLNSCYSEPQATAILPMVDAVVGTTSAVSDEAACLFAETFHRQIADGRSIGDAFRDARDVLNFARLADVFFARGSLDLVLVPNATRRS